MEETMLLQGFIDTLRAMDLDVDGVEESWRLGADLGMDSQEIVDLRGRLNARFGVKLPERSLKKATTVAEAVALIEALATPPAPVERRGACEAKTVIRASAADAYGALFQLAGWTAHLPHVLAVDIAYDDGRYQEFTMKVASKTGTLNVRSIRRCEAPTSIEFFQPKPPPFLLEHSGGWRFKELADGTCEVTTYHRWKTNPAGAEKAYGGTVEEQEGKIFHQLLEHAELALQCWKTALESGAVQRGRGREVESEHQSPPKSRDRHALVSL
jgi:acyl carrier protein